jgi:hypothetical protein
LNYHQQNIFLLMAIVRITKHRDIMPRADTLKQFRGGKIRKQKTRTRYDGEARVLTYKQVDEGLKKLAEGSKS